MSEKNITLTNLSEKQIEWLKKQSRERNMTITGYIKHWIEKNIEIDADTKHFEGFWE